MNANERPVCGWCFLPCARTAFCDKCTPKIGKLARAVAGVSLRYVFVAPVTAEDLEHVRAELQAIAPPPLRARVFPRADGRTVELELWERDRRRWHTCSVITK